MSVWILNYMNHIKETLVGTGRYYYKLNTSVNYRLFLNIQKKYD